MTRRITSEGGSLLDALSGAIAELAGCDREKVEIHVSAPGLDPAAPFDVDLRLRTGQDESAAPPEGTGRTEDDRDHAAADTGHVSDADLDEDLDEDDDADLDEDLDEDDDASESEDGGGTSDLQEQLDEEADAAADFVETLLDILELPGDLKLRVFEDYAEVEIVDVGSGALIGRRGQTLEAIQELLRCSLQREFQRRTRVKVDVEGYRTRRLEKLLSKAEEAIDAVLDTGEAERLEPMDVFERKAIHHLVAEVDGVASRSQGREPGRRVIIEPTD